MWPFKTKYEVTDVSPKVVGFFFAQYVEVMRYGNDRTDKKMKRYLYSVCLGLGVPEGEIELPPEPEEEPEVEPAPEENVALIVHGRRGLYPTQRVITRPSLCHSSSGRE